MADVSTPRLSLVKIIASGRQATERVHIDANMDLIDAAVALVNDPFGWGEITTFPAPMYVTSEATPTANRIYTGRAVGAGPITKIRCFTSVQSGNLCAAVHLGGTNFAAP